MHSDRLLGSLEPEAEYTEGHLVYCAEEETGSGRLGGLPRAARLEHASALSRRSHCTLVSSEADNEQKTLSSCGLKLHPP